MRAVFFDITNPESTTERVIALHHVQEYHVCKATNKVILTFLAGNVVILDDVESQNFRKIADNIEML